MHRALTPPGRLRRFASALGLAALLAAPVVTAFAQGGATVTGRIANAATGSYLENAEVRVEGTDLAATTSAGGRYVLANVPAGSVTVAATYPGLDPLRQTVAVAAGGTATLDFNLTSGLYGDVLKLSAFVVGSTREGNAKAIVEQRQAENIKTVISSDAFGTVSEDNVGEFLKYMSGLSIDYVENDARQVRVRGLSAKYASVTIDGNPVASADFGIATGRSFQFEQVSLSTVDTIELNKTPLADQPADSLAGTINVKSKSALNQKGRRIRYSANLTLNEFALTVGKTMGWDNRERYKALPGGSLEYSNTHLDGRLGVVASINHTGTYVEQKIIANLGRTFDANPANNATEIPAVTQVNWQDGLKPTFRDSLLLNLDYRATPDLILSLRTSYNMYDAPFHNRNWTLGASATTNSNLTRETMATTAASAADTANSVTIAGTNFRKYGATFTVNPAVEWRLTPNLAFDGSVSYSRSYQWYDSDAEGFFNIVSARMNGLSWGFTAAPGSPSLDLRQIRTPTSNNTSFFNLANYNSNNTAQTAHRDAKDQVYTGKANFTLRLPQLRSPTILKFGADSRLLVKDIDTWTKVWSMNVNPAAGGLNLTTFADPYTPRPYKGETLTDLNGVVGAPPSLDKWRLYDRFAAGNTDPYLISTAAQQPFFLTAAQAATNLRNRLQNMWDLEETIRSAYLLANTKPSRNLQFVAGLRFESTETEGRAYDDIGGPRAVALSGSTDTNNFNYILARYGSRRAKQQSYDDLFPSMQMRYSPRPNLNLRAAYYRSILRPDVQNVARSLVVNDTQTTFTTANPDLRPEYADNFDARIEQYFEPVGVISAGVFYKRLKDVQFTTTTDFTLDNVPADIVEAGFDPATLVASSADYTRVANGPSTSVWGFEIDYSQQLSFLPGPASGLGVFANYTYTAPKERNLFTGGSGAAKHSANTGLSYRGLRTNGQVKFNWVGERLLAAAGTNGVAQFEKQRLQIDLNAEYQVSRRATLFANVANVTGAPSVRYAVHKEILIRHGAFGAKYTLGVKGAF
jgi:iron complex outermembrane receptor protein